MAKVVNKETGKVFADFSIPGKPKFSNKYMQASMDGEGIMIPNYALKDFDGKRVVYPDDGKLFEKAFKEIFFKHELAHEYDWVD